jgi:hypothetical protein
MEAMSAGSPSLAGGAPGTFFNRPRPLSQRPRIDAIGMSSTRAGRRLERRQWLASVTFENGSAGKARSIIISRKSSRPRSGSRADSIRSSFPFR